MGVNLKQREKLYPPVALLAMNVVGCVALGEDGHSFYTLCRFTISRLCPMHVIPSPANFYIPPTLKGPPPPYQPLFPV